MAFCPKCGNKVNDGDQFCVRCGNCLESSVMQEKAEKTADVIPAAKRTKVPLIIVISIFVVCAVIAAAFFIHAKMNTSFSDDPAAIEQASKSVILLECYDKNGELYCTGSAFAAFEDGVFVTNYHVVEQEVYSIIAKTEDGTMFEIDSILASEPQYDIAIIRTNANPGISPLPTGSSADLEKGEKVVAIGSPLGLMNTVSTGVFSGYNDTGVMNEIQFSASISHGSSGGALFNDAGEVIGITSASYTEGQNLNVAVPIHYVIDIKNTQSEELTIPQFYETFDHYNEYTVDEVLQNRDMKEERAYVYGIVAGIKEHEIVLVSDEVQLTEYQRLLSACYSTENTNYKATGNESYDEVVEEIFKKRELEADRENLKNHEINNTVGVYDKSESIKLDLECQVGDIICVLATINPDPYGVRQISIQNEECITRLSE